MTVIIARRPEQGGFVYEIDDFASYSRALEQRGIEPPPARYRVFVSIEDEVVIRHTVADWEEQIALFFKLGPTAGIDYRIVE